METIRSIQKKYGSNALALAVAIGFLFFLAGMKPIGKGLILGALFSVVNFVLMSEMMPGHLGKSTGRVIGRSLVGSGIRYLVLAVPLVIASKFEGFDFFGAFFGIFMVQLIIVGDHIKQWVFPTGQKGI